MRAADIFRLSFINALRGRTRTTLTIIAIAIGVAATILVVAIGSSARVAVNEQLDSIGISGIAIYPRKTAVEANVKLTGEDAVEVMAAVDGIKYAMPVSINYGTYSIKNWRGNALIYGINEQLGNTLNLTLLHGRLPTISDVRSASNVAVIDDVLAQTVYSRTNIVGKTITLSLDGVPSDFIVIGIISSQSSGISALIGEALPAFIYIPYTAMNKYTSASAVEQLLVAVDGDKALAQAVELLNRKYNYANAFNYEDISGYRSKIDGAVMMVSVFIGAVGAISMIVAGIGIMNSMISTAIERKREVGIYMSLGARRRDIMLGFLTEAGIISAVGGFAGVVLGIAIIAAAEAVSGFSVTLEPVVIIVTECAAVMCGVVFGVMPAVRASRLDPIEALRD